MRHATRRAGAHRDRPVLARDENGIVAPTHRRGSVRSERRYAHALAETPVMPHWGHLADPGAAEPAILPSAPELDTVVLSRVTEAARTVVKHVRARKTIWERIKTYPDWWILRTMVGAMGCGILIAVLGIMPTGTVPDVPYGSYTQIIAMQGVDGEPLSYYHRAEVTDRDAGR